MNVDSSALSMRVKGLWAGAYGWFTTTFATPDSQRRALVIALCVCAILLVVAFLGFLMMPSKRKVVRKRVVRRVRRRVTPGQGAPAEELAGTATPATATPATAEPETAEPETAEAARPRSPFGRWPRVNVAVVSAVLWAAAFVFVAVASYFATGSDVYCAGGCHGTEAHVAAAMRTGHARCVQCHEADPVSGIAARMVMAVSMQAGARPTGTTSVDASQCFGCHHDIAGKTITSPSGVTVSHKEFLSAGWACSDCHPDAGHSSPASIAGGMARCMGCHDGRRADDRCVLCHRHGSPLAVASAAAQSRARVDFEPAIHVANRNCRACHADETRCISCHGLELPHPEAFIEGGHARMAAFEGKQLCLKCHTITWCGNDRCHHSFSAHNVAYWRTAHQRGTSDACGSCHMSWRSGTDFCRVCH